MDESTLFANIFETGRDPLEWLEDYIRRFAESSGNIKLFPGWFGKFNTGYKGFGVGKVTSTTGDDGDIGKYRGFLYTDTDGMAWTPGNFARPDLATMEVFIQLRLCIDLKVWLTEYVKANYDDDISKMWEPDGSILFPEWWIEKINPNWTGWDIFFEGGKWWRWVEKYEVYRQKSFNSKDTAIMDLVNFIWNEVESVKFKEIK